ncbi:MAG: methyltransferase domain-containing protein [Candidatus Aenigmatarchaeota archaeon]
MKVLLSKDSKYVIEDNIKEINTKDGIIKIEEGKEILESHLGKKFSICEPNLLDILSKLKRGPQAILPKDAMLLLAYTGIKQNSLILEGGTGNAFLSIQLAWYLKPCKIYSFEKDPRFYPIAKENIKKANLEEYIEVINDDIFNYEKYVKNLKFDLIFLDFENSNEFIKHAFNLLKNGAYLAIFNPTINSLVRNVEEIKKYNFQINIVENIIREWQVEFYFRPKTLGILHTGFLIIARKIF